VFYYKLRSYHLSLQGNTKILKNSGLMNLSNFIADSSHSTSKRVLLVYCKSSYLSNDILT